MFPFSLHALSLVISFQIHSFIAQIHFFTLDTDATFQKLVAFWIDKLKQAGCHIIYDTVADPYIVKALQMVGVQLQPSDNPKYKLKGMI